MLSVDAALEIDLVKSTAIPFVFRYRSLDIVRNHRGAILTRKSYLGKKVRRKNDNGCRVKTRSANTKEEPQEHRARAHALLLGATALAHAPTPTVRHTQRSLE